MLVSFSGIDGAGKSTQIKELERWLAKSSLTSTTLEFWDDVVLFSALRESASHKAFKGDTGVGSPERPLHRRDKNVTAWPVTVARYFFYFADVLGLRRNVSRARKSGADVVIFDRYIYDELANLPLHRFFARNFARFILWLAPRPDLALIIDADPAAAHARKPEYPLQFVRHNRESYLTVASLAQTITIIAPDSVAAMKANIRERISQRLSSRLDPITAVASLHPAANRTTRNLIQP